MEEESLCSSIQDIRDSAAQKSQQESRTSSDHLHLNGQQETVVWHETETQINMMHSTERLSPLPKGRLQSPEEAENQWEQIVLPVYPMTCTAAPLSFATVQWDMPDLSTEVPSTTTDSCLADELLSSGGEDDVRCSPRPLPSSEDTRIDFSLQEDTEKQDEVDLPLPLNTDVDMWCENLSQVCL